MINFSGSKLTQVTVHSIDQIDDYSINQRTLGELRVEKVRLLDILLSPLPYIHSPSMQILELWNFIRDEI